MKHFLGRNPSGRAATGSAIATLPAATLARLPYPLRIKGCHTDSILLRKINFKYLIRRFRRNLESVWHICTSLWKICVRLFLFSYIYLFPKKFNFRQCKYKLVRIIQKKWGEDAATLQDVNFIA